MNTNYYNYRYTEYISLLRSAVDLSLVELVKLTQGDSIHCNDSISCNDNTSGNYNTSRNDRSSCNDSTSYNDSTFCNDSTSLNNSTSCTDSTEKNQIYGQYVHNYTLFFSNFQCMAKCKSVYND